MWLPALHLAREAVAAQVDCSVALDGSLAGFLGAEAVQNLVMAQPEAHVAAEYLKWVEAEHRRKIRNRGLGPGANRWCLGMMVAAPAFATAHRQTAARSCWTVGAVPTDMVRFHSLHS